MKVRAVKIIQRELQAQGLYGGAIDGQRGPITDEAVQAALTARSDEIERDTSSWSAKRKAICFLQLMCKDKEIEVGALDGLWGPQTEFAYDALVHLLEEGVLPPLWRDITPLDINPNHWPMQRQAEMEAFYGPHCDVPLVRVEAPWQLKIAWNLSSTTRRISCHEKVADSLGRVLTQVHDHYGDAEIKRLGLDLYGGCYNCRNIRGGSSWSTHSWGMAIDWDPGHNQYNWGRDRARMAHPDYEDWWRFWEEEGWLSLGRTRNFDWMHIQAAKL